MRVFTAGFFAAILFLTSCGGDSTDRLMKDQIGYLDEMTKVIEEVVEGGSAADAAEKIRKFGKKGGKLMERKKKLFDGADPEELQEITQQYVENSMEAARRMMAAMTELQQSGRATPELIKAVGNMKSED